MIRRWRTTLSYWARDGDGEVYIREQRDRLLPWRGRRVTVGFEGREVTV